MFETKLKVLQNLLKTIEIETKRKHILLDQGMDSISKLIHDK